MRRRPHRAAHRGAVSAFRHPAQHARHHQQRRALPPSELPGREQRRDQRLPHPRGPLTRPPPPSREALALLDVAACGLLQTLEDGTIVQVNRTFCTWVGYEPAELIGLVRLQSLLAMGARIFHQTHWSPLLRMQGSVSEIKLSVNRRGGGTVPMVLNAIRREQDGVIVHEIATFVARDRDNYERELVRSRKRLEELVAETTRLHAEAKERALFAEQLIA
ncbi:MAG: PAS domain S-box protein, partial [Proteobacteria bacterium]